MASVLIQLADAVTNALNNAQFSQQFTAQRSYADRDVGLEGQGGSLRVDVVPVGPLPSELETRGSVAYQPSVDILVRYKFQATDQTDVGGIDPDSIDPYVALIEEIHEYLTPERPLAFDEAAWQSSDIRAAVIHPHLRAFRQFTGVIRVTYSVSKQLVADPQNP